VANIDSESFTESYYHAPDKSLIELTGRILDQHDQILKINARLLQALSGSAIIINSKKSSAEDE
jgi:hypothetical protein